ncbi:MAG TPA: metallophosphoesterase family protein, partial [Acidilobales archaeon]|nr:metallophosphoesterase family protein [Acidilobales archaeon]
MRISKILRGSSLLLITIILITSVLAIAAYVYSGITITSRTEIKEPIRVYRIKGLPSTLWPGDVGTIEFKVENKDTKPYIINCTVKLPWPGDGVADGRGIDVIEFIVGDQNRTADLRDDGVAHFVIEGKETLTAKVTIKAHGDVPSGVADITIDIIRSVVLNDPPRYIHLSWAVNDVYHTMTIMWWTEYDVSGNVVVYDTVSHEGEDIAAYRFKAIAETHQVCAYGKCFPGYWHEVTLTGLQPGTTYYFKVGGPGGWSKEYKFRTIDPNKPVKIVVTGDSRRPWGEGYELKVHPEVTSNYPWSRIWLAKAVATEDPDAVIFVGDMVNEGNNWEHWSKWFEDVTDNLITADGRIIPIIAVIGNHEMGAYPNVESTYEWFKGVFANPGNELWFSLDFPNLHVLVLATTGGCVGTWWAPMVEEAKEQVDFIKEDLASTDAKWIIAAFHVPYYDCFPSGTGYPSEVLLKYWAKLLEEGGVDMVFTGHVHNYMRSWPLRTVDVVEVPVDRPWTKVGYKYVYELKHSSEEGTTYVVVGTAGAPTDPYEKGGACAIRDFMASAYARHMYVLLEINSTNIH